ncbi:MAG: glycine cleavage system protein GcvH [Acidobacteria bacterium]|nr:glycine cleavage system protein GcvH [Acidobacteriota bacterium]
MTPDDLLYTKEHEWLRLAGDTGIVGITDHAQKELGDVVYVELPKVGGKFDSGETFGNVESVKAVSELFIPVSGEVVEVNEELGSAPETINADPYGKGWMIRIRLRDKNETGALMSAAEYDEYTKEEE